MVGNAVVHPAKPAGVAVNPTLTAARTVVVLKRSHTTPDRVLVRLGTSARYSQTGTLTRSSEAIRLFDAASGGTEIAFVGNNKVFTGAQLTGGVRLFAVGVTASATLDDFTLTLTLTAGGAGSTPPGPPATVSLTCVDVQLDIHAVRTASGVDPPSLDQPPDTPPAPGTATDKWFGGRLIDMQDPARSRTRAMLTVRQVRPVAFKGTLVLRQVVVTGDTTGGLDNKLRLFDNETPPAPPAAADTAKGNQLDIPTGTIPPTGLRLFAEGGNASARLRDTGFQLGIKGGEKDGDRVALTVGVSSTITPTTSIILVSEPGFTPARQLVTLRTTSAFSRNGTLERSSAAIHFFTAASGGTEIPFDGIGNVFNGARLTAGVRLFAEGVPPPSANPNDIELRLILDAGNNPPAGSPGVATLTAAQFSLTVQGARQIGGPAGTSFLALRDPAQMVTVEAAFTPALPLVPPSFVTWSGGNPVPGNPLQRTVSRANVTSPQARVRATVSGASKSVDIFIAQVMLDVDANRDGVVGQNEASKNTWNFGAGQAGAVLLFNNDNDNKPAGDAAIDHTNDAVDGASDVSDLAPLIVRRSGPLPAGVSLVLTTANQERIRVFHPRAAAGTPALGPSPLSAEFPIATSATADVTLGMEATQYPDAGFDGVIGLALVLREGASEIGRDEVKVRIAPWVMPSHLQVAEELHVVEITGFNTAPASTFMAGLQAAAAAASVPLRRAAGATFAGDPWMQDTMEIGFSQMPGTQLPVVLDAVRTRGLDPFAASELLGPNYGFFRVSTATPENTFDSHGNLEVSPPVNVGAQQFKLGRIYFGRGRPVIGLAPAEPFNADVKAFLLAQRVQKPFEINTSWLAVGHVDEIITFVPATGGKGFKMLLASPTEAIRILTDLRNAGNGALTLFTGKPAAFAPFNQQSINTILGNVGLINDNTTICQPLLDGVQTTMVTELGLDPADIVKIPTLFVEYRHSPRRLNAALPPIFVALTPGMVNMLVITRPTLAQTQLAIPKPFGPVLAGVDQLEKDVRDKLSPLGYAAGQLHFIDDFDSYHISDGEVHCGTNTRRTPPTTPWWEQVHF